MREELGEAHSYFYLLRFNDVAVGFLKNRAHCTWHELPESAADAFEVQRLYLAHEARGKGVGRAALRHSVAHATALRKKVLWLKAMDRAHRLIAFYESLGFEVCGSHALHELDAMKADYRGMVVLRLDLQ